MFLCIKDHYVYLNYTVDSKYVLKLYSVQVCEYFDKQIRNLTIQYLLTQKFVSVEQII